MLPLLATIALAPQAWVFDHSDQWTQTAEATKLLTEAGFTVNRLTPETDIASLPAGMILLGSFSTEAPGAEKVFKNPGLDAWIRKGGVLVEMTQADQTEARPPFLPKELTATRDDADFGTIEVTEPSHPLMAGLPERPVPFHAARTTWETFRDQKGFQVLMTADWEGARPALMTATLGNGAIVLSSIALDKTLAPAEGRSPAADKSFADFRQGFFRNLKAWVESPNRASSTPTASGIDLAKVTPGSWSLAVLPDTQVYAESYPGIFDAQTAWIKHNVKPLDIKYVLHLGDITNRNTPEQWQNAYRSMSLLHGSVSYALAPGNHDYGPGGNAATRDTYVNDYFKFDEYMKQNPNIVAFEPGKIDNTYHRFEAGGKKWIVIALEWAPRDEAVAWANEVMTKYKDHIGILITHAYMFSDSTRYDWSKGRQSWNPHGYQTPGTKNDGEQLWQKLVSKHRFAMTLNGHVLNDGTGYLVTEDAAGRKVPQILANYQMRALGGSGYLRVMEFQPDGRTVRMKAYSPIYDRFIPRSDHSFDFQISE